MMDHLVKLILLTLSLLLFSCNSFSQAPAQDNWRMHLYTTTFEIKDPKVMTRYFSITLPPSLTIGNIQTEDTFVEFTSPSRYRNNSPKERLTVHVYTKKLRVTRDRAMNLEMEMAAIGKYMPDLVPPPITPEEKQYIALAIEAKPQEFKIGDLNYAIKSFTLRSVKVVFMATNAKDIFYIFQLASFDDDKAIRESQISEMIASIKSIQYNDVPAVAQ